MVVPGKRHQERLPVRLSHLKDIPPVKDTDKKHDSWFHSRKTDPDYFNETEKRPMVLEAGQYFIFAERTLHHSNPNLTNANRTGISFRVTLPMVKADHDHACVMLSGRDNIGINKFVLPPTNDPQKTHRAISIRRFLQAVRIPSKGDSVHSPEGALPLW